MLWYKISKIKKSRQVLGYALVSRGTKKIHGKTSGNFGNFPIATNVLSNFGISIGNPQDV